MELYDQRGCEEVSSVFKALGHPVRLWMAECLSSSERTVQDFVRLCGLDYSTVSLHLKAMRDAGIVTSRKRGNFQCYRLIYPCIPDLISNIRLKNLFDKTHPVSTMKFQQIRSATSIITFGRNRFLIDPWFAPKDSYDPIPVAKTKGRRFPFSELPLPVEEIVSGIDAVIVTHLHFDHFDASSVAALPKVLPLFCQDEADAAVLRGYGFVDVRVLPPAGLSFQGVSLHRTECLHGQPGRLEELYAPLGMRAECMGVVFSGGGEDKVFYLAADTIWFEGVQQAIATWRPDVIALNAAEASAENYGRIIMGLQDIDRVLEAAPHATLIATHMDAVGHAELCRADLRRFVAERHLQGRLLVPDDGETLDLG